MVDVGADPFFINIGDQEIRDMFTGQQFSLPIRCFNFSTLSVELPVPNEVAQAWLP